MLLQSNFPFRKEDIGNIVTRFSDSLALDVGLCLREAKTEGNDQDWWASAKPKKLERVSKRFSWKVTWEYIQDATHG